MLFWKEKLNIYYYYYWLLFRDGVQVCDSSSEVSDEGYKSSQGNVSKLEGGRGEGGDGGEGGEGREGREGEGERREECKRERTSENLSRTSGV